MSIQAISAVAGPASSDLIRFDARRAPASGLKYADRNTLDAIDPAPAPNAADEGPSSAPTDAEHPNGRAHGVLRLLESGHFKGVADVRLRINFFEELSARAQDAAAAAAPQQTSDLIEAFDAKVEELLSGFDIDDDAATAIQQLRDGFEDAVASVAGQFDGRDVDGLAAGIQDAFDAFLTQLRDVLAPAATTDPGSTLEPAAEATDVAEGLAAAPATATTTLSATQTLNQRIDALGTAPADSVEPAASASGDGDAVPEPAVAPTAAEAPTAPADDPDPFATLASAFTDLLSDLVSSLLATGQLPDPSPSTGNGAAYEKFLAIYNELRGASVNEEA
jgi:hypothetical protein